MGETVMNKIKDLLHQTLLSNKNEYETALDKCSINGFRYKDLIEILRPFRTVIHDPDYYILEYPLIITQDQIINFLHERVI